MAKKTDEFVAYVTKRFVSYLTTPKETRAAKRTKSSREPVMTRWFGMLPMALGLMVRPKHEEPSQAHPSAGETVGQG